MFISVRISIMSLRKMYLLYESMIIYVYMYLCIIMYLCLYACTCMYIDKLEFDSCHAPSFPRSEPASARRPGSSCTPQRGRRCTGLEGRAPFAAASPSKGRLYNTRKESSNRFLKNAASECILMYSICMHINPALQHNSRFQSCRVPRLQFYARIPRLQISKVPKLQGSRVPYSKVAMSQGKVPRLQGSRIPRMYSRFSRFQEFQDYRVPRFLEF